MQGRKTVRSSGRPTGVCTRWPKSERSDVTVGRGRDFVIGVLIPLQAVFSLVWFLYTSCREQREDWLKPFGPENVNHVGTVLVQFAIVPILFILANRSIVKKTIVGQRLPLRR